MNSSQELIESFEWLLSRIDKAGSQADGKCHPSLRRLVVKVLERCLIDVEWLFAYSRALKRLLGDAPRAGRALEGRSLQELGEGGLRTLGIRELIRLALDPVTLWALYYRIRRCARPSSRAWSRSPAPASSRCSWRTCCSGRFTSSGAA